MVRLSGWVREQNAAGVTPRITPDLSRRVSRMRLPRLRERASRVLAIIARDHPVPRSTSEKIEDNLEIQGVSYSKDAAEVRMLLQILGNDGLIRYTPGAFFS